MSQVDTSVSINSRAFNYGDGFFETIKILNSKPFNFVSHLHRINRALTILNLQDCTSSFFKEKVDHLIKKNNIVNGIVKIHISRSGIGKYLPDSDNLDIFMCVSNSIPYQKNAPISACFYNDDFKTLGALSNIKSLNALVSILASMYASKNNYDNGILLNSNGYIIEASNANIYMVKDKIVYTPPLADGCVDGTMRRWLLEELDVIEESITKDRILNSDEVFISNASNGFITVLNIEQTFFSSSKTAEEIQQRLVSLS